MAILRIKDETGKFVDIPAIQGAPGKDGAIQYEAGEGIKIEGNVISATGGVSLEDVTKITGDLEKLPTEYKDDLVGAISEVAGSSGIPIITDEVVSSVEPGIYILSKTVRAISINGGLKAITSGTQYRDTSIMIVPAYQLYASSTTDVKYPVIFQRDRILTWVGNNEIVLKYDELSDTVTKEYVDDAISAAITTVLEGEY